MKIHTFHRSERGAALMTTLVFSALLLAMSAAILSWSTSESRLNRAHSDRWEARNAAEALIAYGTAHASKQVRAETEYSASFCDPSNAANRLSLTAAQLTELFGGTNIDPNEVEVVGRIAQVNTPGGYFVDPANLRNNYTSFRLGDRGKDGRLTLLARASTLPNAAGRRQSIFLQKTYTILDVPVFQYAAFYNMDLEVAPGPQFNIYGPVHTNGNLWVSKQSNSGVTLSFWESVSAFGFVRHGFKVQPIQAGGTRETANTDPVRFINPAGSLINLYGNYGSFSNVWRDQFMGGTVDRSVDFLAFSNATYGSSTVPSNLRTKAHGVSRRALPGQLDNYVEDPNPIDGIIAPTYRNVPRALIERPLYPTNPTEVEYIGDEVEKQKMSRKAGLYIIVNADFSDPNPTKAARAPDGTLIPGGLAKGEYRAYARTPASTALAPIYVEVKLPGQPVVPTNALNSPHTWIAANAANPDVRPLILVRPSQMTDMRRFHELSAANAGGFNHRAPRAAANSYQPKVINLIEVDMTVLRLAVDRTVNGASETMIFPYDSLMGGSNPAITSNLDDRYRSTYRSAVGEYGVNSGAGLTRREGLYTHADDRYLIENMSATSWDGSVYIESVDSDFLNTVDAAAPAPADAAGVLESWRRRTPGHRMSGVRLINGRGPVASASAARVANAAFPCSFGLTLTTNDPLYILGHFNADGRVQTNAAAPLAAQLTDINVTDAAGSGNNSSLFRDPQLIANAPLETPVALVADAVTILSHPTFNRADTNGDGAINDLDNQYQTGGWTDLLSHLITDVSGAVTAPTNWIANWRTTPLSNANSRDGHYNNPGANNVIIIGGLSPVAIGQRSPLERFVNYAGSFTQKLASANTGPTYPSVHTKFAGTTTEISAGFIIGLSPSENNPTDVTFTTTAGDGNNSGGLHNLPRFLERWNADCAIRGSMVVMFESKVAWEPFNLRVYGPPGRQWGFHNFFRNFYFSDDIPATRNVGTTNADSYQLLSRADYIARRNALWSSYTFPTPP